jgi:hypothetical protein
MNTTARVLAIYLLLVFFDGTTGFRLYRWLVHKAAGVYCTLTKRSEFERARCTSSVFYSSTVWAIIALFTGIVAGYVTHSALRTRTW